MAAVPVETERGLAVTAPASPSRLLVAGDTHGNAWWINQLAELAYAYGCDGIVQLGDYGFWPHERHGELFTAKVDESLAFFDLNLWWLDGNHENHTALRALAASAARDAWGAVVTSERTRWLPRGHRWSWNGVSFGALGGAFSIDWHRRTPGRSWWPEEVTTEADVELLGDAPLDVLLCHDGPAGFPANHSIQVGPADEARSYEVRMLLAQAAAATRPRLVLHGHWHRRHSTELTLPSGHVTRVEGLASDNERDGRSWGVLTLPTLTFLGGREVDAEHSADTHRRRPPEAP